MHQGTVKYAYMLICKAYSAHPNPVCPFDVSLRHIDFHKINFCIGKNIAGTRVAIMLKLCLNFEVFCPNYAYNRYAYKNKLV